jgi:hypothetical protein
MGADVTGEVIEESRDVTWLDGDHHHVTVADCLNGIR